MDGAVLDQKRKKETKMKSINVCEKNRIKIDATLLAANGRATEHTYSADQILALAMTAEKNIVEAGVLAKDRRGAHFVAVSGGSVARSYKYARKCTQVTLVRHASAWHLAEVARVESWQSSPPPRLFLTDNQISGVTTRFRSRHAFAPSLPGAA